MTGQETVLTILAAFSFTLAVAYLLQAAFVYRTVGRHLYASICAFGLLVYIYFQIRLISSSTSDIQVLLYHRYKAFGLFLTMIGWGYTVYSSYFKGYITHHIFAVVSIPFFVLACFPYFSYMPIEEKIFSISNFQWIYRGATPKLFMWLYIGITVSFAILTAIRFIFVKMKTRKKVLGILAFLPLIVGISDIMALLGLSHLPMTLEISMLLFLFSMSALFLLEERDNHKTLKALAESLEDEVEKRTEQLREANRNLLRAATTDLLTGLYNRQELYRKIEQEKKRVSRMENGGFFTVAFIDLDNFKFYNDTFGHHLGDFVLTKFASMLKQTLRLSDVCARFGGDEFIVIFTGTPIAEAERSVKRLYDSFKEEQSFKASIEEFLEREVQIPDVYKLGFSTGLAEYHAGLDAMRLLEDADRALYSAKQAGKNRYRIWDVVQ